MQWRAHNVKAPGLTLSIISMGGLKPVHYVGCAGTCTITCAFLVIMVSYWYSVPKQVNKNAAMPCFHV